jgi:hypothetical protein
MPSPPPLSRDRAELMRRLAKDGRELLMIEAKLRKLPIGRERDALLRRQEKLQEQQDARLLRVRGVTR